jgi:glycosyltransferase involved in cell wall biosynthesis
MSDRKTLIIVLGPHRSGTSLCTAALECFGAELRLPEHYANEENRKGFFEHPDIVEFNDSLLSHLQGSWDNPLFDGPAAVASTELSTWIDRASNLFESIFAAAPIVAVKDPRFCQLLDFWIKVFIKNGYREQDIFLIQVLRQPIEVALSQQHRAKENPAYYEIGRELIEGSALWLSLSAQALEQIRQFKCYFVDYVEFLSTPETLLVKLAVFLGLDPDRNAIREFCAHFVDASLHRSIADDGAINFLNSSFPEVAEFNNVISTLSGHQPCQLQVIRQALDIYRRPATQEAIANAMAPAISRLSHSGRKARLDAEHKQDVIVDLDKQISEHVSVIVPLREQIERLEQGNSNLQQQLEEQSAEIDNQQWAIQEFERTVRALEYRVGEMEASTSWKLTAPVRELGAFRNRIRERLRKSTAKFRLRAIYSYQRMSVNHPRLAWASRIALRPLFRVVKHFAGDHDPRFARRRFADSETPMVYQQTEASNDYKPFVSIIVPNYNHANYLALRLDSIYSQSYRNFEVILLDDASTDGSEKVLAQYVERYPANTQLVVNDNNSGGVFHQWEKGLRLAKGDIIWIAESDDWCTENFLEQLIPFFENESIQLAYCQTLFMNAAGDEPQWSIHEYLHDIDPDRWKGPIVDTAHRMVADAFALKNIIPNVSSAVFRNPGPLELLQDPQWKSMRICGDWIFYLHLIRGGVLAYTPHACNYYRMHGDNTSVKSYSDDKYYAEHEVVAKTVQKYFQVDPEIFIRQKRNLIAHWRETRPTYSDKAFDACYSLARIEAAPTERAPNLLMASYAFCTGGGETFPVELANLMKAVGHNVTYLDCAQEPRNEGVRNNLRKDIPIVSDFSQLEKIVTDFGIDLIHSHHAWVDSTILDLLPEVSRCKTVVTLHGMYETINNVDLKFILPRLVKRSARLIYVAEKNLSALTAHKLLAEARLVRIENALPDNVFPLVSRRELGIPDEAFVLTLVSRAIEEKGWQEAVEIVMTARKISGKEIHLVMVGDGPEQDRLINSGLPPFIHITGFQRNVRGYFALADAGFLPSKFRGESSPLVAIECLQAGRPFLASALGDIPYMLSTPEGPAGILVDLNELKIDVSAWAEKIDNLVSDQDTRQSLRYRVATAVQKFDSTIMAQRYDELYRSVLSETK